MKIIFSTQYIALGHITMPYRSFAIVRHKIKLTYGMTNIRALVAQIEQQNKFPSSEMIERLAIALETDTPDLFSVAGPFPVEAVQS